MPDDFAFTGSGEHLCLLIRKRGENTRWVARQLAAGADVAELDVGYCGLKDRRALTTQWFSVSTAATTAPDWARSNAEVLELRRHQTKLRRGEHAGNRFLIRLRDVEGERTAIEQRLAVIPRACPIISARNVLVLMAAICPLPIGSCKASEASAMRGKAAVAQNRRKSKGRPPSARIGDDPRNGIFLSAARSWLFNLVLAERVRTGCWRHPLDGEAIPEGPLWGRGRLPGGGGRRGSARTEGAAAHGRRWLHALEHVV